MFLKPWLGRALNLHFMKSLRSVIGMRHTAGPLYLNAPSPVRKAITDSLPLPALRVTLWPLTQMLLWRNRRKYDPGFEKTEKLAKLKLKFDANRKSSPPIKSSYPRPLTRPPLFKIIVKTLIRILVPV